MNKKQQELNRITKIVIDCCAMKIDDEGKTTITLKDVKSKSRRIDLVMTIEKVGSCCKAFIETRILF